MKDAGILLVANKHSDFGVSAQINNNIQAQITACVEFFWVCLNSRVFLGRQILKLRFFWV